MSLLEADKKALSLPDRVSQITPSSFTSNPGPPIRATMAAKNVKVAEETT